MKVRTIERGAAVESLAASGRALDTWGRMIALRASNIDVAEFEPPREAALVHAFSLVAVHWISCWETIVISLDDATVLDRIGRMQLTDLLSGPESSDPGPAFPRHWTVHASRDEAEQCQIILASVVHLALLQSAHLHIAELQRPAGEMLSVQDGIVRLIGPPSRLQAGEQLMSEFAKNPWRPLFFDE